MNWIKPDDYHANILFSGAYVLVLAEGGGGGVVSKLDRLRSIDRLTTHINTAEIRRMIIWCD